MSETTGYLQVGNERMHFLKWGSGPRLLLAFHGYGEEAASFRPLQQYLETGYNCYIFDLPHHGKSNWTDDTLLETTDLIMALKGLMERESVTMASLLGYSMGGRVCLGILEQMPHQIQQVTLLAADGMARDFYYHFFTRNFLGKRMFRHMLTKPAAYFKTLDLLRGLKLLDESRYKFVMHYLGTEKSRRQLSQIWPAMSDMMPDVEKVKGFISRFRIPVHIFMGKFDRVMPPGLAENFKSGLETVHLHIVEKGHGILDQDNAPLIAQTLL